MKRRFADARGNKDILESDFKNYYIEDEIFRGNISFLKINKVRQKWCVDEEDRCILDNGYLWMEIYPEVENYCITAMCDEKNKAVEWYFDICKCNGIEDNVPYEDDLYLDVVIVPDGRIHILDEDELQQAFNEGKIEKEELEIAYKTKELILEQYGNNIERLQELTSNYLEKNIEK